MKRPAPPDDVFVNSVLDVMSDCLALSKDASLAEAERRAWRAVGLRLSGAINQFELERK